MTTITALLIVFMCLALLTLWSFVLIVTTAHFIADRLIDQDFCKVLWEMFHDTMIEYVDDDKEE